MDSAFQRWVATVRASSANAWSSYHIGNLATVPVPEFALGPSGWLLRADAALTWGRWLLAGIVDPAAYVAYEDNSHSYATLYATVRTAVVAEAGELDRGAVAALARLIADAMWDEIQFERSRSRRSLSKRVRDQVWLAAEPEPRCHLCGYVFEEAAKERYFGRPADADLPLLVDFTRPRGRYPRDLYAEIDHVRAVAAGGADQLDNLRLACGWCNRAKSFFDHLYAVPAWRTGTVHHPRLGVISVPHALWVVRFVSSIGGCEHIGCSARVASHELFVAPRRPTGALTPTNIAVWCSEHDRWKTERFIGPALLSNGG